MQRYEVFPRAGGIIEARIDHMDLHHAPESGTAISLGTQPPTEIAAFPHRLIYERGSYHREIDGEVNVKWGGKKLMVAAQTELSRLLVDHTGKTVYIKDPIDARQRGDIDLFSGKPLSHAHSEMALKLRELFKNAHITEPRSFAHLTFGQILRFFRDEEGLTRREYANRSQISEYRVEHLEKGRATTPQGTVDAFLRGFSWTPTDPRSRILQDGFIRAKKTLSQASAVGWNARNKNRTT